MHPGYRRADAAFFQAGFTTARPGTPAPSGGRPPRRDGSTAGCAAVRRARRAVRRTPAPPGTLTPEVGDYLESLFTASKKGSAELREQVAAFFDAHR